MHFRLICTVNCINFCWSISPPRSFDFMEFKCLARPCQLQQCLICVRSGGRQLLRLPQWPAQPHTQPCLPGSAGSLHISVSRSQAQAASSKSENKHPLPHIWSIACGFEEMKIYGDREHIFVSNENQIFLKCQHLHAGKMRNGKARNKFCWYLWEKVGQTFASCYLAHKYCMAGIGSHCFCVYTGSKVSMISEISPVQKPTCSWGTRPHAGSSLQEQGLSLSDHHKFQKRIKLRVNALDKFSLPFYPVWYISC